MKRNQGKAQKDILYISISFFVVVALWISSNIYHAAVTSTISEDLEQKILPIDPNFDAETIEKIKNRRKVAPDYSITNATPEANITPSQNLPQNASESADQPIDELENVTTP